MDKMRKVMFKLSQKNKDVFRRFFKLLNDINWNLLKNF